MDSFGIDRNVCRRGQWLSAWAMVQSVEVYGEGFADDLLEQFIIPLVHGPRS